ncbi:CHASE2 domain-containing protein [Rhodovibrionaceae bacterium A322]
MDDGPSARDRALVAAQELQEPYLGQKILKMCTWLPYLPIILWQKLARIFTSVRDRKSGELSNQAFWVAVLTELTTLGDHPKRQALSNAFDQAVTTSSFRLKILVRALMMCALVLFVETLIPWNLLDASHQASQDYLYRLSAPYFPHASPPADKEPLVVMLTDQDQRFLALDGYPKSWTQWPPDVALYAEILDTLLSADPAVVFVDVGFLTDRQNSDVCRLAEVLESYRSQNIPVLLAGDFSKNFGQTRGAEVGANYLCENGRKVPYPEGREAALRIAQERTGEILPHFIEAGAQAVSIRQSKDHYLLFDCAAKRPSAALKLHQQQIGLEMTDSELQQLFCNLDQSEDLLGLPRNQMSIYWSNRNLEKQVQEQQPAKPVTSSGSGQTQNSYIHPYACVATPETLIWRILLPVAENFGLSGDFESKQSCPPYRTLSAQLVLESFDLDDEDSPRRALIHNNAVLLGADFRMGNDLTRPPTHDRLPGVYRHAMALENLQRLSYQPNERPCLSKHEDTISHRMLLPSSWASWANLGCGYLSRPPEFWGVDTSLLYRICSTFVLSLVVSGFLYRIGSLSRNAVELGAKRQASLSQPGKETASASLSKLRDLLPLFVQYRVRILLLLIVSAVFFLALWLVPLWLIVEVLRWEPETLIDIFLLISASIALNLTAFIKAVGRTSEYLQLLDNELDERRNRLSA